MLYLKGVAVKSCSLFLSQKLKVFYKLLLFKNICVSCLKINTMTDSQMYNLGLIPLEVSEAIKNRTCFYKQDEYRLTLEDGKLVLEIYDKEEKEYYDL